MSAYQTLKLYLLSLIPLTKDATHIYIGMLVLLIWVIAFRRPLHSLTSLIPVVIIASIMEMIDLYDDMQWLGYPRWSNSWHDLVNTCFWPAVLVISARYGWLFRHRKRGNEDTG